MNHDPQVVLLLKFALTIGPIAVYFLALGYLNAQARPQLLSGRSDFILLAVVFFPILLWAMLLAVGLPWLALAIVVFVLGLGLYAAMPRRQATWVIYNVSERQFRRALDRCLGRLGLDTTELPTARPGHPLLEIAELGLRIRLSPFPLLQNVSVAFERTDGRPVELDQVEPIRAALADELGSTRTLPSASAACFLLIGTAMLSTPLLMMARHMDEIVKVVRSFFA